MAACQSRPWCRAITKVVENVQSTMRRSTQSTDWHLVENAHGHVDYVTDANADSYEFNQRCVADSDCWSEQLNGAQLLHPMATTSVDATGMECAGSGWHSGNIEQAFAFVTKIQVSTVKLLVLVPRQMLLR